MHKLPRILSARMTCRYNVLCVTVFSRCLTTVMFFFARRPNSKWLHGLLVFVTFTHCAPHTCTGRHRNVQVVAKMSQRGTAPSVLVSHLEKLTDMGRRRIPSESKVAWAAKFQRQNGRTGNVPGQAKGVMHGVTRIVQHAVGVENYDEALRKCAIILWKPVAPGVSHTHVYNWRVNAQKRTLVRKNNRCNNNPNPPRTPRTHEMVLTLHDIAYVFACFGCQCFFIYVCVCVVRCTLCYALHVCLPQSM